MAIKINIALTAKSGLSVPAGAVIAPKLTFPRTISVQVKDGEGVVTGYAPLRFADYLLKINISDQSYLDNEAAIVGGVKEFEEAWRKDVSEAENVALLANGMLAQTWLKDYLEGILGADTCEIFDPFAI